MSESGRIAAFSGYALQAGPADEFGKSDAFDFIVAVRDNKLSQC